jgi:hypothetical protein
MLYSVFKKKRMVAEKYADFCTYCRLRKYHTTLLKLCRIMH